ncbi:MAG: GntR family transcriptional regulator [Oricola sp.]
MAGQTETVIEAILTAIDEGRIGPGDAIDEQSLIEQHGVSRTPVREALIRLETAGLVQRHARKGAVLFKPTLEEFLGIIEVHARLEAQAAGLAARRLTPDLARELEAIVQACEKHAAEFGSSRPAEYYQLNLRFHEVIARAAGNPFLVDLIKTNARKLMAYYRARYRYPGSVEASAKDHRAIAALIATHRREEAEAAMETHFNYDRGTVMDLLAAVG